MAALCLFGCGGGGGGTGSVPLPQQPAAVVPDPTPPAPPPPAPPAGPTAESFRTTEYNLIGVLDAVHAAEAYALGYTGAGVTIGFVDFNFNFASNEIRFHAASVGPDPDAIALYNAQTGETADPAPHGTAVAITAAGIKNGSVVHGIAFDAQVLAVDYFSGVNETVVLQSGTLYHVSDPWTYITSRGVRIINTSIGYDDNDVISNPPHVTEAYVTEVPARAVANGALLVSSAGNNSDNKPSKSNFDTIADLQSLGILNSGPGAYIIAGAVDSNNQIATFSDRAGTLRNNYMVAPGVRLVLPWTNGDLYYLSGTSFSAPLISGAAAVVLQRWPQLTARQVMQILFDSATDLGATGVDSTYGHGLLNLYAALQPNGITTFSTADGGTPFVSGTAVALGPAFGDARAFRSALSSLTMFDRFGRDYGVDFSHNAFPWRGPDVYGTMLQALGWRGAGFRLGSATAFSFHMRDNPEDGLVPFGFHGGPETNYSHEAMFRFSGAGAGVQWTAGSGFSLHDALAPYGESDPFAGISLTRAFSSGAGLAPGAFATASVKLGGATDLSFGISQSLNLGSPYRSRIAYRDEAQVAALRLDTDAGPVRLGFELGASLEEGGLLGSMAAGGLKMADRASTTWSTLSAETQIAPRWSLKAAFTATATAATTPGASLIASIGPVYATSFALGLARGDLIGGGDALSFTIAQPLRAERAPLVLVSGMGRDSATGEIVLARKETSLLPSGRELDLETAYRFPLGDWTGAANVAYSMDAGHVREAKAVSALFFVSRKF